MTSNKFDWSGIGVLALLGAVVGGCAPGEKQDAKAPIPTVDVVTSIVVRTDVPRYVTLPADVLPWQQATLYAKVPGYVEKVFVDKGDLVAPGQLLAKLSAPELQYDSEAAKHIYEAAQGQASAFRSAESRSKSLSDQASADLEKAKLDLAQGPSLVHEAELQRQEAKAAEASAESEEAQAQNNEVIARADALKANAELTAAQAEAKLADLTYRRYVAVMAKDKRLIAQQMVDEAQAKSTAATSRVRAAESGVVSAKQRIESSKLAVKVATDKVTSAKARVTIASERVSIAQNQAQALKSQLQASESGLKATSERAEQAHAELQQSMRSAAAQLSTQNRAAVLANYSKIVAPFRGTITNRFVDAGALVQNASNTSSATSLFLIQDVDMLRVDAYVPEDQANFIHPGSVAILIPPRVGEKPLTAKVKRTSGALDPKPRTLLAEVQLENKTHGLLPGAYVSIKLVAEVHPHVLAVPSSAVGSDKSGKYVYTLSSNSAKRTPVTIGFDDGKNTEILTGLAEGQSVISTGKEKLTNGAPVRVITAKS